METTMFRLHLVLLQWKAWVQFANFLGFHSGVAEAATLLW